MDYYSEGVFVEIANTDISKCLEKQHIRVTNTNETKTLKTKDSQVLKKKAKNLLENDRGSKS